MTEPKSLFSIFFSLMFLVFLSATLFADFFKKEDPVKIDFSPAVAAKPGSVIQTHVELYIESGFHVFSNRPEVKGIKPTSVEVGSSEAYQVERIEYPKPESVYSEIFQQNLGFYHGKTIISVYLKLKDGISDKIVVKGAVKYQACSNKVCYAPKSQSFSAIQTVTE
jgi:DsbC/DsbD-like thiol-disulfide interchange protein